MKGISYYRLKQTDFDGQYSYSDIVAINNDGRLLENIYPQPANEFVILTLNETVKSFKIYNTHGMLLFSENDIFQNILKIDVSDFVSGTYFITVLSDLNSATFKFIVDN